MSYLFWFSTLVPGFALLQTVFPYDMKRGLLGALSLSFVLTIALTTPIIIVAYGLHLTVSTVGVLYLGLVLLGLIGIASFGRWPLLRRSLRGAHWPEIGVILFVIAITVPLGGSATDDSFPRSATIRYLRDVGFRMQDPYSPIPLVETKHHANPQFALYAIVSQLTGEEPLEVWFKSAWFFRLLGVGGVGFLAATVFRSRWIGTIAMIGALGFLASLKAITYPYAVASYVVVPILLAQIIDQLERPTHRGYVKILLSSLSLGLIHVGHWLIAAICLLPPAFLWAVWQHRGKGFWRVTLLIVAALLPGIPLLLITALQPNYVDAQQGQLHLWMLRTIDLGHGWKFSIIDPTHFTWMLPTVAVTALLLALRRQCRVTQLFLAAVFLTSMVYMFTPVFVDALAKHIPYWLIQRARFIGEVIAYVSIAGGLAWVSRRALPTRACRMGFAITVFCAGIVVFRVSIKDYFEQRQAHRHWLQRARELQEVVHGLLPERAMVAADPEWSLVLPAVHVAAVMAPELFHANPADANLLQRHKEREELARSRDIDGAPSPNHCQERH